MNNQILTLEEIVILKLNCKGVLDSQGKMDSKTLKKTLKICIDIFKTYDHKEIVSDLILCMTTVYKNIEKMHDYEIYAFFHWLYYYNNGWYISE